MEHLFYTTCYVLLCVVAPLWFLLLTFNDPFASSEPYPSTGTSAKLRIDLMEHLEDDIGLVSFRAFLADILAEENLDFHTEVEALHKVPAGEVPMLASSIFNTFLSPDCSTPINVTAVQMKRPVDLAEREEWDRNMYDDMQKSIFSLMLTNGWSRYLDSKHFIDYTKKRRPGLFVDAKIGWFLIDSPCVIAGLCSFIFLGNIDHQTNIYSLTVFAFYLFYYIKKSLDPFIYAYENQLVSSSIVVVCFFNSIMSGFLQGTYMGKFSPVNDTSEFYSLHFMVGLFLFISGWIIQMCSDDLFKRLRRQATNKRQLPFGGFNFITAAGEITLWTGYAIAQWGIPGLVLLTMTFSNLAPRVFKHFNGGYFITNKEH
eukprot:TRINITY_DN8223_c0_g1_i1.p1 TRINITY_DN8223_c0_g1~~TRINITY_DN8223_c0_g1_i1.p1  ORF type:complete len:371 (+),score=42.34 TRINITY_DN8223_c0_g1_i1:10-1122(+)